MKIGQSIWHCAYLGEDENGVIQYAEPKEYKLQFRYLSITPVSGYLATLQYGKQVNKIWRIIANRQVFEGIFNEGDLLYIDGVSPTLDMNYYNGDNANARVQSVLPQLVNIVIDVERIQP